MSAPRLATIETSSSESSQRSRAGMDLSVRDEVSSELSTARSKERFRESEVSWQSLALCSTARARVYVPIDLALRYSVLPLGIDSNEDQLVLTLAANRTLSTEVERELRFVTGTALTVEVVAGQCLDRAIRAAYFGQATELQQIAGRALTAIQPSYSKPPSAATKAASAPVPLLLDRIIERATFLGASDVHLEPDPNRVRIRYRVHGELLEDDDVEVSHALAAPLFRRIKIVAQLDPTIVGVPLDGGFTVRQAATLLRVRVSCVPQYHGEKVVMRILVAESESTTTGGPELLAEIGLAPAQIALVLGQLVQDRGVLLSAGPTGSGKSTLLYTLLRILSAPQTSVVTLEDPVERLLPGATQIQVDGFAGANFGALLRAALRQDPNVLMVGEVRDRETAETALTAGLAGMQVLSTVHASACLDVVTRLHQLGVSRELVATSLRMIISQRLVLRNCPACIYEISPTSKLVELFKLETGQRVRSSAGCSACDERGQQGRTGVFEVLPLSEQLRTLIAGDDSRSFDRIAFAAAAYEQGFRPLAFAVRDSLISGAIPPSAALKALGFNPRLFGYL